MRLHPALLDSQAGLAGHPELGHRFLQQPLYRMPVDIAGDERRLLDRPPRDRAAPVPLFAKLGAKSWRGRGAAPIISEQRCLLAQIERMLDAPTDLQRRYLALVRPWCARLDLILFRYLDFSDVSEARWRVGRGGAQLSSVCLRGASAAHARAGQDAMRALALAVGKALGVDAVVDLAVGPDGAVSILEVNPGRDGLPVRPGPDRRSGTPC